MRTLLERCFGSFRLARRWIEYVRERKSLRARIDSLERDAADYRFKIATLQVVIEEKAGVIRDLQRARRELPDDVQWLLEEGHRLIANISMGGAVRYSVDFRAWLGEYNARKAAERRRDV